MTRIDSIEHLPPLEAVAVIINCSTKVFSTLALASAIRFAKIPVLLIDCASTDGSLAHFEKLARKNSWRFYALSWPLRAHGVALDHLFGSIPAQLVLLMDSDLEILGDEVVSSMRDSLGRDPRAFGSGFLNPGEWLLPPNHMLPPGTGFFAERMWLPLTLLRVQPVREAIHDGVTFLASRVFQEFPRYPALSRLLYYRFRLPLLRDVRIGRGPDGKAPLFIDFDTGAEVYAHLKAKGHSFLVVSPSNWKGIRHFSGVTRARLGGRLRNACIKLGMIGAEYRSENALPVALERLRDFYGIDRIE